MGCCTVVNERAEAEFRPIAVQYIVMQAHGLRPVSLPFASALLPAVPL